MAERFIVVLGQVLTLFLLMAVGFLLGKTKKITPDGTRQMSFLLMNVVVPCVTIQSFQTPCTPELLRILGQGMAGLAACYLIWTAVSCLFFRKEKPELRGVLRFGSVYANNSFMGLPLVQAVMGDDALIFAVVSMAAFNLFAWTLGVMVLDGREAVSLKKFLLSPTLLALLVGFLFFLTGFTLPGPIANAMGFISNLNTPLAMLIIGAQMGRTDLASTFRIPRLYEASFLKLFVMPAIAAAIFLPLRGNRLFFVTSVILAGAPTAAVTGIFAEQFHKDTQRAAQLVSLGTLISIITLPLLTVAAESLVG